MNLSGSQSSSSSAHTTPFAQQSPPPRRKPSHCSNTLNLSSSSSAFNQPSIKHQARRSRIPLQWRAGDSLVQPDSSRHQPSTLITAPQHIQSLAHCTTTAKLNDSLNSTNILATDTKERQPTRKLSSIPNFLRSQSISPDHSSTSSASSSFSSSSSSLSVVSPSSQIDFYGNGLHPLHLGYIGIIPIPSSSDHGILETWPTSLTSTHTAQRSSSCSFHHSTNQSASDCDSGAFQHEHSEREILCPTSQSQLSQHSTRSPTTPSPGPQSNSTPTHSSHYPPSALHSSISNQSQHQNFISHSPSSSAHINHVSPVSLTDLPFACPSPIVPRRLKNRPKRPVPTRAPPLPRSQTPSLLIRPKFSPCSNLDLAIQPVASHHNSNVRSNVFIDPPVDLQERPISDSTTDMIRHLGRSHNPIKPPHISSSFHLDCPSTSSIDLSIDHLASHRSLGPAQICSTGNLSSGHVDSSSPQPQARILRTKTKKFRDRFTLSHTAPLKISKRQKTHHTDNQAPNSDAGRRIVSGLLNALSPTNVSHVMGDPAHERRKAEFKKKISYPVLNHASGDDTLSHCGHEEPYDDDTDCYNLTIEAAVRSLEGIRSNGSSPRITRQVPSSASSSASRNDVPISTNQNFNSASAEAQGDSIMLGETTQIWRRKLRKRISGKLLMVKSSRNQVEDDEAKLDFPSAGSSQQVKGTHKQLKSKAGARFKPLLHRVSSLSLRQRAYFGETEAASLSEPSKSGHNDCIILDEYGEEEELALAEEHLDARSNSVLHSELKLDSRFRWIRSSISKKKIARTVPLSEIDLKTPTRQPERLVIRSSQSIREKRKIFEPDPNYQFNDSLPHPPTMPTPLLSASLTPADQYALRDARLSTDASTHQRSSMLSQRPPPTRKPTPAEIKLKDETRSVKALVNKFEHHSYQSLPRSVGSDYLADITSQHGRASSTGFVRNSLPSVWSAGGSSINKNPSSTRSSKRFLREQRRKRRGWSSGNTFSGSECAHETEALPIQKLKKKKKNNRKTWSKSIFQDDDSSFSSFGCDLQERDEEVYEAGPISDHTEISDSSYRDATMLSTSSIRRLRWTCSDRSSRDESTKGSEENSAESKHESSQSSSDGVEVAFHSPECVNYQDQVRVDYELPALSDKQSSEPENFDENKTWSLLSSDQAHTVLEPQTVWMGDGSERKILVAGGQLQMAKKIPFPSFEDDAEFSQPVNLPQNLPAIAEPFNSKSIVKSAEKDKQTNRISSFLRIRKFDNHEYDDDDNGANNHPDDLCIAIGSKLTEGDLSRRMMYAADNDSLQDSPTHGRGQRSFQRSMLMVTPEKINLGNHEQARSIFHLLPEPMSEIGRKDQHQHSSCKGSPNSIEMKQMCLSVDRCQGLGSKMFGSSINIEHRPSAASSDRCSARRSASAVVGYALFQLSPNTSRPRSQPPMYSSAVKAILNAFETFDSVQLSPSRSPLISSVGRSSIMSCDIPDRAQGGNSAAMADLMDSCEGATAPQQFKTCEQSEPNTQLNLGAPKSVTNLKIDGPQHFDLGTMGFKALKLELSRLERVQEKWRQFCLEVEDVLQKSRERWPDLVESDNVLGEFCRPTTKSTFLESSQRLHKDESSQTMNLIYVPQCSSQDVISQLTPSSKHPFNSRPMTPSTIAGYPSLNSSGRLARAPHVVTLPVPSTFVSPEKFLGADKIPKNGSEKAPRAIKISNRSRQFGLRQNARSNRLESAGFKPATDRNRQAHSISVTSSTGSLNSGGKAVLAERPVNQSPVIVRGPMQNSDENPKILSSPKIPNDKNVLLIGSLGRMNRPSMGKWARENEGSQWTSVSMRETRKPWRRSILNSPTVHGPPDNLRKSSFASHTSTEEVGILVADGDQPHEFAPGFHTSESLRLKHRRRLNRARSDKSIAQGAHRIHLKPSKTDLGDPSTSLCQKASFQSAKNHFSESKRSTTNRFQLNNKKSQITGTSNTNQRI